MEQDSNSNPSPDPLAELDEPAGSDRGIGALVFTAALLLFGVVILLETMGIRSQARHWPRILAIGLIGVAALRLLLDAMHLSRRPWVAVRGGDRVLGLRPVAWRQILTAVWIVVFVLLAPMVGFGIACLVLMPVYMWLAGFRRPVWIVLITLAAVGVLTLLFDTVANVPMWTTRL